MIGLCRKFVAFLTKNSAMRHFFNQEISEMNVENCKGNHPPRKVCRGGITLAHALQGANSGALTAIISNARTRWRLTGASTTS